MHFFGTRFTKASFDKLLRRERGALTPDALREAYLGFLIVKPLPQTPIGRTCLKTYPTRDQPRYFTITPACEAHLFGLTLGVNTLPFQEQDKVAAACATSALWSVFQATARRFQHQILSPVEITRAATASGFAETRTLPNLGLSTAQMANAVRGVELEPLVVTTAYYRTVSERLRELAESGEDPELAAEIALLADEAIRSLRVVDWQQKPDVQNRMRAEIDDRLFELSRQGRITLNWDAIDEMAAEIFRIAKSRVP